MEPNRRPRIIKRTPLYRRILNAPEDYTMKIGNDIRALDWDMLQEGFSWPLALSLNLLLASVKLGYWLDDPLANFPIVFKDERTHYSSKSMRPAFASLLAYLQYILVAISFINAFWLFQSKKNYKMLNRDLDDRPSASNIKMVEVQQEESHWSFRFPGRFIYPFISPFMRGPKPQENKRHVWEMSVWDPSILSRNLFCWYSPAQVLIMAGMNSENLHIFLPLSIIVGLQVHFLISVYQSYVKDKQILFGEVNREYNAKFVYPRIFVRKFDKQVSTEPDLADSSLQISDGEDSFRSVSDHKPRKFQHLSIPASSFSPLSPTRSTVFRGSPQMSLQESTSGTSSSESSEDDDDEDEEEEEDISDNEIDDEGVDPDLDYDEEGEEPAVPHPTNALRYSS